MTKKLISEQTIIDLARRREKTLKVDPGTIVTDAARDRARQLGIRFVTKETEPKAGSPPQGPAATGEVIALGSDHGGFGLKEQLKPFLEKLGYKPVDLGTYSEESCDYPDYAYAVARMVSMGQASRGIMIDSIGLASAIVANKIKGIRATCCFDEFSARSAREHNNSNVLTLGGRVFGVELAKSITEVWLKTPFGGGRHQKRLEKISEIENKSLS